MFRRHFFTIYSSLGIGIIYALGSSYLIPKIPSHFPELTIILILSLGGLATGTYFLYIKHKNAIESYEASQHSIEALRDKGYIGISLFRLPPQPSLSLIILSILTIMVTAWIVPGIILYIIFGPLPPKKAFQFAVFICSLICGIFVYYFYHDFFPTTADKITYFTSITLGPYTIAGMFL